MATATTEQKKKNNGTPTTKNPSGIAGSVNLSDEVVATIAGMAAREIPGIHTVGKSRWIPFTESPTRGVDAEVGNLEAAIDIEIEIEYGCNLEEVANQLRTRIAEEVAKMATRDVVEININVIDVRLPEPEPEKSTDEPRVR